jgi:hypothetical protein
MDPLMPEIRRQRREGAKAAGLQLAIPIAAGAQMQIVAQSVDQHPPAKFFCATLA